MKHQKLNNPHIYPLTQLSEKWERETGLQVPYFDPDDGGVKAKLLLLFEKPGPSIFAKDGSGFVSQDNCDHTAAAIKNFLHQAKIPRTQILIWNIIVTWNGTRCITPLERASAPKYFGELLGLLKSLKTIVKVGKEAEKVLNKMEIEGNMLNYNFASSLHPSPINRNRRRSEWESIPKIWAAAARSAGI